MRHLKLLFALWALLLGVLAPSLASAQPAPGLSKSQAQEVLAPKVSLRGVAVRPYDHLTGRNNIADVTFSMRPPLTEDLDGPLVMAWGGWHMNASQLEGKAGLLTINASAWLYDGSVFTGPHYITFNGGQATAKVGGGALVWCDPLRIGRLPAGTANPIIQIRTHVVCTLGAIIPSGRVAVGSEGWIAGDSTETGATPSWDTTGGTWGPSIVATLAEGKPWCLAVAEGDSLTRGTGDSAGVGGGWVRRRLDTLSVPYALSPLSGESLYQLLDLTRGLARARLASFGNPIIGGYGTNDIAAGRTVAQMKADYLAYWRSRGFKGARVYQITIGPKTTSTDNWATLVNQTQGYTADELAVRNTINTWLRDPGPTGAKAQSGGYLTGIIDTALQVEVDAAGNATPNGGYWRVGCAFDPVHPSTLGHTLMGNAIPQSLVDSWKNSGGGVTKSGWVGMSYDPRADAAAMVEAARVGDPAFAI